MWLAPGMAVPRYSAHAAALPGIDRRLGGVDVEVAGAGVLDVAREDAFQHAVQPLDVGVVQVARAPARLEQEQRVAVQGGGVEVVGVALGQRLHRLRIGLVLVAPLRHVEALDVAHRQRVDVVALAGGAVARRREGHRLLERGIRVGRLRRPHRSVEVRAPGPGLAPVADGAVGVVGPRLAERADRVDLGEGVHQLHALVEELLRLLVVRGDGEGVGSEHAGLVGNRLPVRLGQLRPLLGGDGGHRQRPRNQRRGHDTDAAPSRFRHALPASSESIAYLGIIRDGTDRREIAAGDATAERCDRPA